MKETGILFTAPMVRALLDGSKSQTRRMVKPQPANDPKKHHPIKPYCTSLGQWNWVLSATGHGCGDPFDCPYGQPGDRLWVRETFIAYGRWETRYSEKKKRDEWHFVDMTLECDRVYQYAADNPDVPLAKGRGAMPGWWTRPAIFMPRAASRILLDVSAVRVERLNDCSDEDAIAEGIGLNPSAAGVPVTGRSDETLPVAMYRELWESINGAGSWAVNPWAWVVEFKRVLP